MANRTLTVVPVLRLVCLAAVPKGPDEAMYVGGTMTSIPDKTKGELDLMR
jgi:hypothetical protein